MAKKRKYSKKICIDTPGTDSCKLQSRLFFKEEKELERRHVKFNLQELLKIAVNACKGVRSGIKVTKCPEGLHNKAFILTMDNGSEVLAKLPNPNAGPAHFTVASEVATRELLRHVFNIPVPQIFAWSNDASANLVKAEYIIEKKAPGIQLGSAWHQWPRELKLQLITRVIDLEDKLTSISFDQHECIYFKDDLRLLTGEATELQVQAENVAPKALQKYALGNNEMLWIKSKGASRMNYYRSSQNKELPADGLELLKKYMDVAHYLGPSSTDESGALNVLWHPELHLDNIFVDPDTHEITSIIDWQSACVAPLFYQSCIPRLCRHLGPVQEGWKIPQRPDKLENKIDNDLESEILHKNYEAQVCKRAPRHWKVLQNRSVPMIRKPVWLVTRVWENRDLFFLRESLMELVAYWDELFPDVTYPIEFTREDVEMQAKENENIKGIGHMLTMFRDQAALPVDGMVDPEDYDVARKNCRKFKDIFVELGKDDEEKELFRNLWPYQESEAGTSQGSP
ncbi:phosphotransferase enzyme family protein [Penicillium malachiteum]|uniref:phosphotransferase enzyme family protein n=1 Tax=Penicillium malachiteum TaxID=1324776 RepID=UPI00254925EA|nr:phosphotransferase enzyme family protein [Penicillium malachiteum]KAJ5735570.1 phosphotransferase enzyme family protein [Penicillium malachiteum]